MDNRSAMSRGIVASGVMKKQKINMTKNVSKLINVLVVTGLVMVGIYLVWQKSEEFVELKKQMVKHEAVQKCLEVAKRDWVDGDQSGEEVDEGVYVVCMDEKGL